MRFAAEQKQILTSFLSGRNVKTIVGYVVVNFEVTSCNSFRDNREKYFQTRKLTVAPVALVLFVADQK